MQARATNLQDCACASLLELQGASRPGQAAHLMVRPQKANATPYSATIAPLEP